MLLWVVVMRFSRKSAFKDPVASRLRGFLRILTFGVVSLFLGAIQVSATTKTFSTKPPPRPAAEDLKQKLTRRVRFTPKSASALERLIEVAKAFHIPMGIEWREPQNCRSGPLPAEIDRTIKEVLVAILAPCPSQRLAVGKGLVHVYPVGAGAAPNILDLRIRRFEIKRENVFVAQFYLRIAIDKRLHPERYSGGYNGGTGFPPKHVFSVDNISFSGVNARVRDILDAIARSNGNALWLARTRVNPGVPLAKVYNNEDALVTIWRFIPLEDY
jgi:hypothetical protein